MIDTVHAVQTPEGVDLRQRVAGPFPRVLAYAIDAILMTIAWLAGYFVFQRLDLFGTGLLLIWVFLVNWFYFIAFEQLMRGQSPGKRSLGLRVVHENGTPVAVGASVLRNFLRIADALPTMYLVGLVTMVMDPSFRRLGDLAAGTLVVYAGRIRVLDSEVPDAVPLPPNVPLTLDEQSAVIAFAQRAHALTPERAAELASLAVPLHGAEPPRERLVRMAAWLVGRAR